MFVEIERVRRIFAALAGTAILMLGATACDDDGVTGPIDGGAPAFSREITLPELDEALTAGPVRVEVELLPGGATAREVELELPEKLMDAEEIEDRISSISVVGGGGAGELTLQSTGLTVEFNSSTRFEGEDGDLTLAEFAERVESALTTGRFPAVEAKRVPPAEPQAPDDPTFVANRLELDDEAEEPKIELNMDGDNLELNSGGGGGEPDGWIRMLGLRIELRINEGITELEQETAEAAGEAEFEGIVSSVDPAASTVTLTSGAIIEIVPETRIEDEADDDDRLTSLAEVQAALDAGEIVEADGEGVVRVSDPLTITAVTIEFEIEDDEDDVPGTLEFEDRVMDVDLEGGTFTLANGTLVEMNGTTIDAEGDLLSLQAVADAVTDGQNVRAEGDANVVTTDPRVLSAVVVKFEVDETA